MYARVTMMRLSNVDQAVTVFHDAAGQVRAQSGFKDGLVLIARDGGQAMAITVWDTQDSLKQSEPLAAELYRQAAAAVSGVPQVQTCTVFIHRAERGRRYARTSSGKAASTAVLEEMQADANPKIVADASQQPGYKGFLTLGDFDSGDVIGVSFWDSMAHVEQSQSGYYNRDMEQARTSFATGQWQRTIYEVALEI